MRKIIRQTIYCILLLLLAGCTKKQSEPTLVPEATKTPSPTTTATAVITEEPSTTVAVIITGTPMYTSIPTPTDTPLPSQNTKEIVVTSSAELVKALGSVQSGETIVLREGRYEGHFEMQNSGTEQSPITITAYPGEKVVFTIKENSDGAALYINGCHDIIIQDIAFLDIKSKDVYGILMDNGEKNITVRSCEFGNIVTTSPGSVKKPGGEANAILMYGESIQPISHITIENNTIHDNVNGWSENISVAGNCEYIYVNYNTVYDCTNIGIDIYGNAEYCVKSELDQPRHCECKGNTVYNCKSFYAENAGIYVDGAYDILVEENEVYFNFFGIEVGSEEWRDYYTDEKRVQNITVRNNYIHHNSECGLRLGGWSNDDSTGVVYNCLIAENRFEDNGDEIILSKCDTITFEGNIFPEGMTYLEAVVYDDEISKNKIRNILFK